MDCYMRAACGCYFWDLLSDEKFIAHTRAMEEKKQNEPKIRKRKQEKKKRTRFNGILEKFLENKWNKIS